MSSSPSSSSTVELPHPHVEEEEEDLVEWEEWDGTGKFWHHCVAGSIAGVAEHTLVYPFDTVKTHLQACATCPHNPSTAPGSHSTPISTSAQFRPPRTPPGMWTTMRHIVSTAAPSLEASTTATVTETATLNTTGIQRLWRGVVSVVVGCIPAHALYFSTYEAVKYASISHSEKNELTATGSMLAGGAAAISHDVVMAPLDTIKQRLQLGHYGGLFHALQEMIQTEGLRGLFRSFPITLLTNIPYGMVMVSTNELGKQRLTNHGQEPLTVGKCLMASSVAGMAAAAMTTPLDRLKTFLQTQQLQPACDLGQCPKLTGPPLTLRCAVTSILQKEGAAGFFKGLVPRTITHTPAVAISWTTYETAKQWLAQQYP